MDSKLKIFIGVLTIGLILLGECWLVNNQVYSEQQEVTIVTDKKIYKRQEGTIVELAITNNSNKEIYVYKKPERPFTSILIEYWQKEDKKWIWLSSFTVQADYPDNYSAFDWVQKAMRINPGENITIPWGIEFFMMPGRYRFRLEYCDNYLAEQSKISYNEFRKSNFKTIYSNEFASE